MFIPLPVLTSGNFPPSVSVTVITVGKQHSPLCVPPSSPLTTLLSKSGRGAGARCPCSCLYELVPQEPPAASRAGWRVDCLGSMAWLGRGQGAPESHTGTLPPLLWEACAHHAAWSWRRPPPFTQKPRHPKDPFSESEDLSSQKLQGHRRKYHAELPESRAARREMTKDHKLNPRDWGAPHFVTCPTEWSSCSWG